MSYKTLQIYLKNRHTFVFKRFKSISDPEKGKFRAFARDTQAVHPKEILKFYQFAESIPNSKVEGTIFPDVFLLTVDEETFSTITFPKFIESVSEDPSFYECEKIIKSLDYSEGVVYLPNIPPLGKSLMKRLNLECMLLGIQGVSLLAPIDSLWCEFPSVTIVAPPSKVIFSKKFSRKKDAWYQKYFVETYLYDPEISSDLKKLSFERKGRASPDITSENPEQLIDLLKYVNRELIALGKPSLGFLNPFFYLCAHMFSREDIQNTSEFPSSITFWKAHCGLGKVIPERLFYEVERLREPKASLRSRFWPVKGS